MILNDHILAGFDNVVSDCIRGVEANRLYNLSKRDELSRELLHTLLGRYMPY